MRDLLKADGFRMFGRKWIWIATAFMLFMAALFVYIQSSAVDYTVALDRVIFLPMAFYGVVIAGLISFVIGSDFDCGMLKNKLVAAKTRTTIFNSGMVISMLAGVTVYTLTVLATLLMSIGLFERNVTPGNIVFYYFLGVANVLAYSVIFYTITMMNGNRTASVIICMILSFGMLFLCLHTNQTLAQEECKNGVLNPAYIYGVKRMIYLILHDLNPSGQASQLSSMQCLNVWRFVLTDVMWIVLMWCVGRFAFMRKELK